MKLRRNRFSAYLALAASILAVTACPGGSIPATLSASPQTVASTAGRASSPVETVLRSFGGTDGAGPVSNMLAGKSGAFFGTTLFGGIGGGAIYGTTRSGGTATNCSDGGPGGAAGCGSVFKINS